MSSQSRDTRFWHPFADMGAVRHRGARDRARRGRLGLGHRGAPVPRCHGQPVVRQHRPRAPGDRRGGGRAAGRLEAYSAFGDFANPPALRARRGARRAGADALARVPRLRRRRRDRHRRQARPALLARARRARPDAAHQPQRGLPRHPRLRHGAGRDPRQPRGFRAARSRPSRLPHDSVEALRDGDRARRAPSAWRRCSWSR